MSNNVKSVRGLEWVAKERKAVDAFVLEARDDNEEDKVIPEEVVSIAVNRDVGDLDEFFRPTLRGSMPDPFILKEMKEAVERGMAAARAKEKICIYGDYDVDGATSSSILVRYFRHVGCDVSFYIPDRLGEGYGPNVPAVEKIAAEGTSLIIFADSGTMAFDPLAKAKELGVDVVVLDHHQQEETLPEGIIVNPNRKDETGEFSYLCTAGLAFLYLVGLQRSLREDGFFEDEDLPEYNLKNLLGVVALGTVADVVPLRGLNRAYVKLGIPLMAINPGLMGLAVANGVEPEDFTPHTCGFVFGPCINAGGRIDDTKWGTRLLTCDDHAEAEEIGQRLFEINQERRAMQQHIENAAHEQARDQADSNVIIVYGEDWHPGVVGIVASRIKDNFDRSAIVIGEGGKGSARSVDGFDIGGAIIKSYKAGVVLKGGGHKAAGGLTIDVAKIDELRAFMKKESEGLVRPPLKADLEFKAGALTTEMIDEFATLGPFGMGNSEPRVIFSGGVMTSTKVIKNKHVKGTLIGPKGEVDVIMFNSMGTPLGDAILGSEGREIDLYGRAKINEWMGKKKVQMTPEDVRIPRQMDENAF